MCESTIAQRPSCFQHMHDPSPVPYAQRLRIRNDMSCAYCAHHQVSLFFNIYLLRFLNARAGRVANGIIAHLPWLGGEGTAVQALGSLYSVVIVGEIVVLFYVADVSSPCPLFALPLTKNAVFVPLYGKKNSKTTSGFSQSPVRPSRPSRPRTPERPAPTIVILVFYLADF